MAVNVFRSNPEMLVPFCKDLKKIELPGAKMSSTKCDVVAEEVK